MKLKSSKKRLMAITSMAVGVMIFAGAAFANYSTANGYEVGKTALKNLLKNENYTADLELKLTLDGNEVASVKQSEVYDRNGDVVINRVEEETSVYGDAYYSEYYVQDGNTVQVNKYGDDEVHTTVNYDTNYFRDGNFDLMNDANEDDAEMAKKIIRFAELAGDTMIGDLKNNVVYVSGDDNSASYEINLNSVQIPELVNAGLSVIFSSISRYDDEDEAFAALGSDPVVKNVSLNFTVDNQNRLTDGKFNVTLSGNGREAGIDISLKMSYDTAVPQRVDISTLPNVREYRYSPQRGTYAVNGDEKEIDVEVEASESVEIHVDEEGNVIDENGSVVGGIKINENGEGVVEYFAQ